MQVAVLRISYRSAEEVSSGFFLLPVEIFPRCSCNDTGQDQQGNDVRDGHETVSKGSLCTIFLIFCWALRRNAAWSP